MKRIISIVLFTVFILSITVEAFCGFDLSLFENNDNYFVEIDDMDDSGYFFPNVTINLLSNDSKTCYSPVFVSCSGNECIPLLVFNFPDLDLSDCSSFIIKTSKNRYTIEQHHVISPNGAEIYLWNEDLLKMLHELATDVDDAKFRIVAETQVDGSINVTNKDILEQFFVDYISAGGLDQENLFLFGVVSPYVIRNLNDNTEISHGLPDLKSEYQKSSKNDPLISLDEYNKIEKGMTYQQVVKIIGSEGKLEFEFDLGELGGKTQSYSWDGTGSGSASFTFQNGKLEQKFQIMLE